MTTPVPPETGAYLLNVPSRIFKQWHQYTGLDTMIHSIRFLREAGHDVSAMRLFEFNYKTGNYDKVEMNEFITSRL